MQSSPAPDSASDSIVRESRDALDNAPDGIVQGCSTACWRDDHLHLMAMAAARRSVDVSGAASIPDLLGVVRASRSRRRDDAGAWLRVWGYDDALLAERRHPTAAELDTATGTQPTVLHHITGHVAVVNSAAKAALRDARQHARSAADAGSGCVDGSIDGHSSIDGRSCVDGSGSIDGHGHGRTDDALLPAADGVLVERQDLLAWVPRPSAARTVAGIAAVLADLRDRGFVACTDATHTNDLAALGLLARAAALVPEVTVTAMVGADRLDALGGFRFGDLIRADLQSGRVGRVPAGRSHAGRAASAGRVADADLRGCVRVGHAKIMPRYDDDSSLGAQVRRARAHGFPVAVHAMDFDTLQTTLDALAAHPPHALHPPRADAPVVDASAVPDRVGHDAGRAAARGGLGADASAVPDRIEHCALALPGQLDRIAQLGVKVVTQPSFVTRRAVKYAEQITPTEQQWLWPLADLVARGIEVTFGSDAPTVPPDPREWICAAATRRLAPQQRLTPRRARRLAVAPEPHIALAF